MTEQEYEIRTKDISVCIDKCYELSVNADKLCAVNDALESEAFLDISKLDMVQATALVENHEKHTLLFSVATDYLRNINECISDLSDELKAIKESLQETREKELKENT